MLLKIYLNECQITVQEFARKTKLTRMTIYNALEFKPLSTYVMQRIVHATAGKVSYDDLISSIKLPPREKPKKLDPDKKKV